MLENEENEVSVEEQEELNPLVLMLDEEVWCSADPSQGHYHDTFNGTRYQGSDFEVKVKILTRQEVNKHRKNNTKWIKIPDAPPQEVTDDMGFLRDVYREVCLDWKNLFVKHGPSKKEIPFNPENKKLVLNRAYQLAGAIAAIGISARVAPDGRLIEEKNS